MGGKIIKISTMREELLSACLSFKEILREDPRFKDFKEKEEAALRSEEVSMLHQTMEAKAKRFEEALSYGTKEEQEAAQKELYKAKATLDSHPLMAAYNASFSLWRDIEREIDCLLFGPFRKKVLRIGD